MFLKTQNDTRKRTSRMENDSNQQNIEQKQSKDIIWIGIGILIIVLIEIYTEKSFFSTSINRMMELLETIVP